MKRIILTVALFALLPLAPASAPALAQSLRPERIAFGPRTETARVQISLQIFVPGQNDDSEAAEKLRERARRLVYDMAGKECAVLRTVIAEDCQLQNVSVNINRQQNRNEVGFYVHGTVSYRITPK